MKPHDSVTPITPDPRALGLTKAAYAVRETLELLSIGRTSLYAAIQRGELRSVKFGRRTLFLANDLANFLIALRCQHDLIKTNSTTAVRERTND